MHHLHTVFTILKTLKNQPSKRIPFFAVARSIVRLWSYSSTHNDYKVSHVLDTFNFDMDQAFRNLCYRWSLWYWLTNVWNSMVIPIERTPKWTIVVKRTLNQRIRWAAPFVTRPNISFRPHYRDAASEQIIRADNLTCITIIQDLALDYVDESPVLILP